MINTTVNAGFLLQTFDIPDIEMIYIKELEPNGYIKYMQSKTSGVITSYYNKEGLLLKQDTDKVTDLTKIIQLKCDTRPTVYDKIYTVWAPFVIDNLKKTLSEVEHKNEGYLAIIQQQAELLREYQELATASNNIK